MLIFHLKDKQNRGFKNFPWPREQSADAKFSVNHLLEHHSVLKKTPHIQRREREKEREKEREREGERGGRERERERERERLGERVMYN